MPTSCCKISGHILSTLCFAFFFYTAAAQDSLVVPVVKKRTNSIGIKYDLITFDKGLHKPWQLVSLDYTKQLKKIPLIARVNYANRYSMPGLQFEVEAYPVISKKIYSFINAGYSNDVLLFPKYRAGASLYISLKKAWEVEGGVRLLYFSSPTWIYNTGIGKYYKKYWFNLNVFLTPVNGEVAQSYFAKCRYYLNDTDYFMLLLGTGISPDDRTRNIQLNTANKLATQKAEISVRKTFSSTYVFLFNIGYMKQEYDVKKYSHQFNAGIGIQKSF